MGLMKDLYENSEDTSFGCFFFWMIHRFLDSSFGFVIFVIFVTFVTFVTFSLLSLESLQKQLCLVIRRVRLFDCSTVRLFWTFYTFSIFASSSMVIRRFFARPGPSTNPGQRFARLRSQAFPRFRRILRSSFPACSFSF
ncbi:hypothetical protein BZA77DRAFT_47088 [Pyronema omphalodes]|nr:hypothetical protein BZA77DRAFT_47088 [Pyronema omphalodes]